MVNSGMVTKARPFPAGRDSCFSIAYIELEYADCACQAGGLLLHRSGRGGRFLDQRGVLLRDLVHLDDGPVHLFNAGALFLAGGADFADDVRDTLDARDDLAHGPAGLFDQLAAALDLLGRMLDQVLESEANMSGLRGQSPRPGAPSP